KAQEDSVEALNPSRLNSTLVFSPIPAIKEQAPVKKEEPKKRQAKAKKEKVKNKAEEIQFPETLPVVDKPTKSSTIEQDLATQIADIERGRQEDYIGNVTAEVKIYSVEIEGKTYEVAEHKYIGSPDIHEYLKNSKGEFVSSSDTRNILAKPQKNKTFLRDETSEWIDLEEKEEIDARHDAKYVEAVEKGEMTREQAMQALEEVGRKDSKAYAKLQSLEQQPTSTQSNIDAKKAEIERRFPEYVKNFKQSIYDIRDIVRRLGGTTATTKASIFDNVEDKFVGKTITGDNIHEAIKGIYVPGSKGFKRTFIDDIIQEFNNIGALKREYDAEIAALESPKTTTSSDNAVQTPIVETQTTNQSEIEIKTPQVEKLNINIPSKSKENKEKTVEAAKALNSHYGHITSLKLGEIVINQIPSKGGRSKYYESVIIPLGAILHHKIVDNAIHSPIISDFNNIKDNGNGTVTLRGEIALAENDDLSSIVEIILPKELLNDYLDKKEKADKEREEYKKLGFKDINEAMRGADASVSLAKTQLNRLLIKEINAKYNAELAALESITPTEKPTTEPSKEAKDLADGFDASSFFRLTRGISSPISDEESEWFSTAFKNATIVPVIGLIDNVAVGKMVNGTTVMLSNLANGGTLFHEGYHLFVNSFVDPKELRKIYNDVRKRLGNKVVVTQSGTELVEKQGKDLTDKEVDEWMAEEFSSYMKAPSEYIFPSRSQKSLFEKMLDIISNILSYFGFDGFKTASMEELFTVIEKAKNLELRTELRSADSVYKIGNLNERQSNEILNHFNALFFKLGFYKNVGNTMELDIEKLYKYQDKQDVIYEAIKIVLERNPDSPSFKLILDNFEEVKRQHQTMLDSYGLLEFDGLTEEERAEKEAARKLGDSGLDALSKSTYSTIPKVVKLMIASLPDVVNVTVDGGKLTPNYKTYGEYSTKSTVEFGKIFNRLSNLLANTDDIVEQVEKINTIVDKYPSLRFITNALNPSVEAVSKEQAYLRIAFTSQFSKQRSNPIKVVFSSKDVQVLDAVEDAIHNRLAANWRGNIPRAEKAGVVYNDNGTFRINKDKIKWSSGDSLDVIRKNLSDIGFEFRATNEELAPYEAKIREAYNFIGAGIRKALIDPDVTDLFQTDGALNEQYRVKDLLSIASNFIEDDIEFNIRTPEGETQYVITLNNNLSNTINTLKKGIIPAHLTPFKNGYGNPLTRGSKYIGTPEDIKALSLKMISGVESRNDGASIDSAEFPDYVAALIQAAVTGVFSTVKGADRSLVFGITYNHIQNPDLNDFQEAQLQYFKNELLAIGLLKKFGVGENLVNYKQNGQNFRMMDYLPSNITDNIIKEVDEMDNLTLENIDVVLDEFVESKKDVLYSLFEARWNELKGPTQYGGLINENNFFEISHIPTNPDETYYVPIAFSANLLKTRLNIKTEEIPIPELDENNEPKKDKNGKPIYTYVQALTEEGMDRFMNYLVYNDVVSKIEQFNVFYGDPAMYSAKKKSDIIKRTTLFEASRQNSVTGSRFIEDANKYFPRTDKVRTNDNLVKVITKDVVIKSAQADLYKKLLGIDAYDSNNATDAGSLYSPNGYRDIQLRNHCWGDEQEKTWQFIEQQYQLRRLKQGKITESEFKAMFALHLPEDISLEGFKPHFEGEVINELSLIPLPPIKPQGVGQLIHENTQGLFAPNTDKTSGYMLDFRSLEGSPLMELLDWMYENGVDEHSVDSVSKITGTEYDTIFNDQGVLERTPNTKSIFEISFKDYGIQQFNDFKRKTKITLGTQMLRLYTSNYDFYIEDFWKGDESKIVEREQEFNNKQQEGKNYINEIVRLRTGKLYKSLGADFKDGSWQISEENIPVFGQRLIDVLKSKKVPKNTIEGVEALFNLEGRKLIDILSSKNDIDNILQSIIKNEIVSAKVSGESFVQAGSVGWNKDLKFYTPIIGADGKITSVKPMEVMIPVPTKWYPWILEEYGSLEAFNKALPELKKKNPELFTYPANRIPTQGLNLIDVVEVKEFLYPTAGNTIILPYEMFTKTGSDLDFDKLNVYISNIKVTRAGLKYISLEEGANTYISKDGELYQDVLDEIKSNGFSIEDYFLRDFNNIEEGITFDANTIGINRILTRRGIAPEDLEDWMNSDSITLKANENALFENIKWFVLQPENFKQLMSTTDTHAKNLLEGLSPKEPKFSDYSTLKYSVEMASEFWVGKKDLGKSAIAETNAALTQLSKVRLNDDHNVSLFFTKQEENMQLGYTTDLSGNVMQDVYNGFMTVFVDIAKNPVLKQLNIYGDNFNMFNMLFRLGRIDVNTLKEFFKQPVIVEYMKAEAGKNALFIKERGRAPKENSMLVALERATSSKTVYLDADEKPIPTLASLYRDLKSAKRRLKYAVAGRE
ncbi:MAG TPA: hypothetical protein VIK77_03895, partial [Tissierellaceae bacterium]